MAELPYGFRRNRRSEELAALVGKTSVPFSPVFSPSGTLSRVVIRRKQRGSSAILMKMAMKVAGVHPTNPGGLLPAFEETYDIVSTEHGESPSLGENAERALISMAENFQGGETFTIDPQGAWVNADKWPKRKIFERLTELCRELARPRA